MKSNKTKTKTFNKKGGNYISNIFDLLPSNFAITTNILNKTSLYNIKNKLSDYYISNNYDSSDFYVLIDGVNNKIIYISEIYFSRAFVNKGNFNQELFDKNITKTDNISAKSPLYNKIKSYSLIKTTFNDKKIIIKMVVIDDGVYMVYSRDTELNKINKKYSDLFQCEYIPYSNLTNSNYKKCIDHHYKKISKSGFTFITFTNLINNSNINWTNKTIGINFLCKK